MSLLDVEATIDRVFPTIPGWCTPEKGKRMAAVSHGATLCVELGVFGGRGMLAMALAMKDQCRGRADGIDPYTASASLEGTNHPANEEYWSVMDYPAIEQCAREAIVRLELVPYANLVKKRSDEAVDDYEDQSIDVIHQDSNHSEEVSCDEVWLWTPKMKPGALWLFDDTDWPTTHRAQAVLAERGYVELEDHGKWKIYRAPAMTSYSQVGQDRFVRAVTGTDRGTFLDIGCHDPVVCNNTFALEQRGWRGLLIDRDEDVRERIAKLRKSPFLCVDAKTIDWPMELAREGLGPTIDYLSFDLDEDGLEVFEQIPFDEVRFRALTIEHDVYRFGDSVRQRMRELLRARGYDLLCPDVCSQGVDFEDWWIDPTAVNMEVAERLRTKGPADWKTILQKT